MLYKSTTEKYIWTQHAREKMRYYRLTESRVKRIIRHPARVEEGILEGAVACMQPASAFVSADAKALTDKSVGKPTFAKASACAEASADKSAVNSTGGKKYSEIWTMYVVGESHIKIITAWRYPGKSPERDPIPKNIIQEIRQLLGV